MITILSASAADKLCLVGAFSSKDSGDCFSSFLFFKDLWLLGFLSGEVEVFLLGVFSNGLRFWSWSGFLFGVVAELFWLRSFSLAFFSTSSSSFSWLLVLDLLFFIENFRNTFSYKFYLQFLKSKKNLLLFV